MFPIRVIRAIRGKKFITISLQWRQGAKRLGCMVAHEELCNCLKNKGIGSFFQNSDMLVISNENPAWPSSNCFWVNRTNNEWSIGTFLQAIYLVPEEQDICLICEVIFRSAATAIYTVDIDLAARFGLRLTEKEMAREGLES